MFRKLIVTVTIFVLCSVPKLIEYYTLSFFISIFSIRMVSFKFLLDVFFFNWIVCAIKMLDQLCFFIKGLYITHEKTHNKINWSIEPSDYSKHHVKCLDCEFNFIRKDVLAHVKLKDWWVLIHCSFCRMTRSAAIHSPGIEGLFCDSRFIKNIRSSCKWL